MCSNALKKTIAVYMAVHSKEAWSLRSMAWLSGDKIAKSAKKPSKTTK